MRLSEQVIMRRQLPTIPGQALKPSHLLYKAFYIYKGDNILLPGI